MDRASVPSPAATEETPPGGVEIPDCACGGERVLEALKDLARDVREVRKEVGKRSNFDTPGTGLCGAVELLLDERAVVAKQAAKREGWVHRLTPGIVALAVGGLGGIAVNLLLKGHP